MSFGVGSRSRVRGSPDRIFSLSAATVKSEMAAADTRASASGQASSVAASISSALSTHSTSA